jgi:hypothetical protein
MGLAEHTHTKPRMSRCHVYMLTPTWTREGTRPRRQEEVKRARRETTPLGGRVEHGAMAGVEHRPPLPGIYMSSQAPAKPSLVRPIRVEGRRSSIHLHPYPIPCRAAERKRQICPAPYASCFNSKSSLSYPILLGFHGFKSKMFKWLIDLWY